ncbi:MAG: TfoX/Sxy family protein [Candidatus Thermoplasmatota archaeon]
MAYDEGLAERIRDLLPKATEKKMFGGIGWMERGNLVTGIMGGMVEFDAIIIRCPPDQTKAVLTEPGVHPFEQRGKAMQGWVLVDAEAVAEEPELKAWIERSRQFAKTLPAK